MNIACLLLVLGIGSQLQCSPQPAPYQAGYLDAEGEIRTEVDRSIRYSNEILQGAGSSFKLVGRKRGAKANTDTKEISVYLVDDPEMTLTHNRDITRLQDEVHEIMLQKATMDRAYEDCTDADDCVERLYTGKDISNLVVGSLEDIANSHVAEVDGNTDCRCIILFSHDLARFKVLFGQPWGEFSIKIRWGDAVPADANIPNIIANVKKIPLEWFVPTILLHEVGHHDRTFERPASSEALEGILKEYVPTSILSKRKAEEMRADAFAATMMRRACFTSISPEAKQACLASAVMPMIVFVISLWGKEKAVRCVRYFDWDANYPNYYLRGQIMSAIFEDDEIAVKMLKDFLDIRAELARRPWINDIARCRDTRAVTFGSFGESH